VRKSTRISIAPPWLELGITLASLLIGFVLLVAGGSLWLYAGAIGLGGAASFAVSTVRARRMATAVEQARDETGSTPIVRTAWPGSARKIFFAYLGLLVLLFVVLFVVLVAATVAEPFG
jgi:hypothetical protein